jgi:choline kinase
MRENKKVKAIILAAGRGERLRPHSDQTPKCLVRVNGIPILHRQLSALQKNGIKEIAIVTGFMADAVEKYALSNFPKLQFTFIRNPYFAETNTLYSLALAAKALPSSRAVIQLNGDVVFDSEIIAQLLDTDFKISHAAVQYKPCGAEEIKIRLNADNAIAALNKNMPSAAAVGEAVGINKFSSKFWSALAKNLLRLKDKYKKEYFEYAIEQSIEEGCLIYPLNVGDFKVIEIDFPEDLERANNIFI